MKKIGLLILVILLLSGLQLKRMVLAPGALKTTADVVIPRGASTSLVARKLAEVGVIKHPYLFQLAVRAYKKDKYLKAGEYQFAPKISMAGVIAKLAAGDIVYRRLTLPEGLTTRQMVEIIQNEPLLEGEVTMAVREGDLLPETYNFERGDSRDSVVKQAVNSMQSIKNLAWSGRMDGLPLKNADEMMVLASIIEKETGVSEERGLVAAVFVNRLKKGMKLQTDPTVIYALTKGQFELKRSLSRKDLEIDSPYNTYKYYGLPPAPICNPGRASIGAAVNPEESDYLYFVASGQGGHNFATSLNQHIQNVADYRRKN